MKNVRLEPISVGDRFPFYYFRFWEQQLNAAGDIIEVAPDLDVDYTTKKICIREVDNRDDPNDHTKDVIYADLTVDVGNIAHYEWADLETDASGRYVLRFHLVRSGGLDYHPPVTFEFDIINRMPSKLRALM